jgi:hypothetical protein
MDMDARYFDQWARPIGAVLTAALLVACGGKDDERDTNNQLTISTSFTGPATSDTGDATGVMDTGGDKLDMGVADTGPVSDGTADTGEECAAVSEMAEVGLQPADILVVVDNSGSMQFEANAVQNNLNAFATQIFLANIDARVALISADSTDSEGICLPVPLGNGACPGDSNPLDYVHVAVGVGSTDGLQKILDHYAEWSVNFRPTAAKHIILVSDDDSDLSANAFHSAFEALDPSHIGYKFHAIASPEDEILACVAMTSCCLLSAALSQEYIDLVGITGGIFGNLCEQDFAPIFDLVSTQVISEATIACEFPIPEPPEGETFDPDKVNVAFDDGMGGTLEIGRVDSPADCPMVTDGWYYDDPADPTSIVLCDQTCGTIQGFAMASVQVQFGCATVDAPPVG